MSWVLLIHSSCIKFLNPSIYSSTCVLPYSIRSTLIRRDMCFLLKNNTYWLFFKVYCENRRYLSNEVEWIIIWPNNANCLWHETCKYNIHSKLFLLHTFSRNSDKLDEISFLEFYSSFPKRENLGSTKLLSHITTVRFCFKAFMYLLPGFLYPREKQKQLCFF